MFYKCRKGMSDCELANDCITVCMDAYGYNKKNIMIVGEAPGEEEDKQGRPFVGRSGQYLRAIFEGFGLNVDRDCIVTNACRCRPKDNKTPTPKQINACRNRLLADIEKYKPKVLFLFGDVACKSYLGKGVGDIRGYVIPEKDRWIVPVFHPSRILREKNWDGFIEQLFINDIERGLKKWKKDPSVIINKNTVNYKILKTVKEVERYLDKSIDNGFFVFDMETNTLKLTDDSAKICCLGFKGDDEDNTVYIVDIREGEFVSKKAWTIFDKIWTNTDVVKVCHNVKYEMGWIIHYFKSKLIAPFDDTLLMHYVLDERNGIHDLKLLAWLYFGFNDYDNELINLLHAGKVFEVDKRKLWYYNSLDVMFTFRLWKLFRKYFKKNPDVEIPYKNILLEGVEVLCRSELNGCRIDLKEKDRLEKYYEDKLKSIENKIFNNDDVKNYGKLTNLRSPVQLKDFMYNYLRLNPIKVTSKNNYSIDESVLLEYAEQGIEFAKLLVEYRKCEKLLSTYIRGEFSNVNDGIIHGSYFLHGTVTGRLSSREPNLQNIPKRDNPEIRRMFIPLRKGEVLLANDYSQWEVRVLQMYAKDKNLGKAIVEGIDFHAKYGKIIFDVTETDENFKNYRFLAKNGFVFPTIYGASAKSICKTFWDKYLSKRFRNFNEGADFIASVQQEFFNEFSGVKEWQQQLIETYSKCGYVKTLFGRYRRSPIGYNELINTPIQSVASDFTLLSAIRIYKELNLVPVLIIHDDLTYSVPEDEWYDYYIEIKKRMTQWDFEFVNVPIDIESKVGYNWCDMYEVDKLEKENK